MFIDDFVSDSVPVSSMMPPCSFVNIERVEAPILRASKSATTNDSRNFDPGSETRTIGTSPACLEHMRDVEQRSLFTGPVVGGEHALGCILHGHLPAGKVDHFAAVLEVEVVERGFLQPRRGLESGSAVLDRGSTDPVSGKRSERVRDAGIQRRSVSHAAKSQNLREKCFKSTSGLQEGWCRNKGSMTRRCVGVAITMRRRPKRR